MPSHAGERVWRSSLGWTEHLQHACNLGSVTAGEPLPRSPVFLVIGLDPWRSVSQVRGRFSWLSAPLAQALPRGAKRRGSGSTLSPNYRCSIESWWGGWSREHTQVGLEDWTPERSVGGSVSQEEEEKGVSGKENGPHKWREAREVRGG